MTKEEKLKERIKEFEEEKKVINVKIRIAKSDLRWLKIKRLTQRKNKMGNGRTMCFIAGRGFRWG